MGRLGGRRGDVVVEVELRVLDDDVALRGGALHLLLVRETGGLVVRVELDVRDGFIRLLSLLVLAGVDIFPFVCELLLSIVIYSLILLNREVFHCVNIIIALGHLGSHAPLLLLILALI